MIINYCIFAVELYYAPLSHCPLLKHSAGWSVSLLTVLKELCTNAPVLSHSCGSLHDCIRVCLDQGTSLKAARLSSRDRGSWETLGVEEVPKLGNSQDSDRPHSESSFWLCVREFYLVDISIYPTSIWFRCVKAMALRKHAIRKTSSDKHSGWKLWKSCIQGMYGASPVGIHRSVTPKRKVKESPLNLTKVVCYEWSQEDIYSNKGCLVAEIPQGIWLPWVSVDSLNTSPFLWDLWIFSPNVKFVSFIILWFQNEEYLVWWNQIYLTFLSQVISFLISGM